MLALKTWKQSIWYNKNQKNTLPMNYYWQCQICEVTEIFIFLPLNNLFSPCLHSVLFFDSDVSRCDFFFFLIYTDQGSKGFPGSSAGEESACNAGDSGLIPGLGRCAGEVRVPTPGFLGFPCGSAGKESACNVGDLGSILGWEDPLQKGTATRSSILVWRIPWTIVHGVTKSWKWLSDFYSLTGL